MVCSALWNRSASVIGYSLSQGPHSLGVTSPFEYFDSQLDASLDASGLASLLSNLVALLSPEFCQSHDDPLDCSAFWNRSAFVTFLGLLSLGVRAICYAPCLLP